MLAVEMFSVLFDGLSDFDYSLFNKSHKFTHVKCVVPKLGMITVLRVKLLEKKGGVKAV